MRTQFLKCTPTDRYGMHAQRNRRRSLNTKKNLSSKTDALTKFLLSVNRLMQIASKNDAVLDDFCLPHSSCISMYTDRPVRNVCMHNEHSVYDVRVHAFRLTLQTAASETPDSNSFLAF